MGALRIQQIACAEKQALLLTHDGVVYSLPYDTMTPQMVPGMSIFADLKTLTLTFANGGQPLAKRYVYALCVYDLLALNVVGTRHMLFWLLMQTHDS